MTESEIRSQMEAIGPWYHSIKLPYGIVTPGCFSDSGWDMTRESRSTIDYHGKSVLDIASFDGMWAFEAEELGADLVIATDCNWRAYHHFLFCQKLKNSNVFPFYNVPLHELFRRLDSYLKGCNTRWHGDDKIPLVKDPRFDIVQHLGVFYHLRDPLLSLLQTRSVIKTGGHLLFETACCWSKESIMLFNQKRGGYRYYQDATSWWMPSMACIYDVLSASFFEPIDTSVRTRQSENEIGRVSLVARATSFKLGPQLDELLNTYRTPGLET